MNVHNQEQYKILIVDDEPNNLKVLSGILESWGVELKFAINGISALETAKLYPPDIILLDINMPGMDGLTACEILKKTQFVNDIPVIFLTAYDSIEIKEKAFNAGAVDYITKPFIAKEVKLRVDVQIKLFHLKKSLEERNHQLDQAVNSMSSGFVMLDHDFKIKVINQDFQKMFEIPDELLKLDSNFYDVIRFRALRGDFGKKEANFYINEQIKLINVEEPLKIYEDSTPNNSLIEVRQTRTNYGWSINYVDLSVNAFLVHDHRITAVLDYINNNLNKEINVDNMASIANMSRFHFMRIFKDELDCSLMQYVYQRRIEKSTMLLKRNTKSITDIAEICGFASSQHFDRTFKIAKGEAPSIYRNRYLKKDNSQGVTNED